ncbi:MAG: phosphatase PAP2 family protein [Deltaproteobacteria bacterium]|nr:phosphatase PAP2 family protein [Deltaproteobacteria bacterium]
MGFRRLSAPVLLASALAVAAAPAARADELRIDLGWDLGLTLGVGGAWILTETLKGYLAPDTCRWCEGNAFDDGVRGALRWDDIAAADATSYVLGFALLPALMLGVNAASARDAGAAVQGAEDLLLVAEAIAFASALNQTTKFLVGRERPFVHALDEEDKLRTDHPSDNNLSFFSGHTTLAFAAAVSGATVATLRGYDTAPYLWVIGGLMALGTGYLRIAADRHYLSDVLVGAAVGALVGWAVPWLHRASLWDDAGPEETERTSLALGPPLSFGMVF